ncbi:nucleotidyltransferase domain-containing protein [Paenibacillus sp. 481]|uniref:nucleotidyltransferase domain-containing protein n=1 Tax=Paenibacillus sp. 481 TaxID=2835869 RepID=UPI001E4D7A01|nr:nucleotidyltransferase domain-containing protein [Paenibacillus sp. 481]UHA73217.1 nucleotidyltransferase domain-containing protein [Paenibacillus sp. 481]
MQFPTRIGVDVDGFIVNPTSLHKIDRIYQELLSQLIEILKNSAGPKLHSVYIYGSVGRGEAMPGSSDIDLTVILKSSLTPQEKTLLNEATQTFKWDHPIAPKVDSSKVHSMLNVLYEVPIV